MTRPDSRRLGSLVLSLCFVLGSSCSTQLPPSTPTGSGPAQGVTGRAGTAAPAPAPAPASAPAPEQTRAAAPTAPAFSALAVGITEAAIRGHMEFLASDALNGRGSGTRDEWIAATYIGAHFRQLGLEPMGDDGGFVQQIEMAGIEATAPPVLRLGATPPTVLTHGKDMLVWTMTRASASGPIVKYDPAATAPDGAILLLPEGVNATTITGNAALVLALETPAARTQWETRGSRLPTIAARAVKLPPAPGRPTLIYLDKVSYAAANALTGGAPVAFTAQTRTTAPTFTWNTVARLTGTDPVASKEVIVLSAHMDHLGARPAAAGTDTIFNGADDDASGTVAVMALAEALSRGPRPKRTIVFALFGSEERGGFGAGFFVDLPVVPLGQLIADLQFEMLGRPDEKVPAHTLWLTGFERSNLGPELARQGARLVADPRPDQSFFTRSDNIRFARRGIVAHTVSSFNLHKEYHQASDEVRSIDFAHMTDAIRSMLEPIRGLANSPFKPAWAENGCPAPCR